MTGRTGERIAAPDLLDVEVLSGLRGLERSRAVSPGRAAEALDDLRSLPITRHQARTLVGDAWQLRHNFSAYDAMYVALARHLDAALLTLDRRLGKAALALGVPAA